MFEDSGQKCGSGSFEDAGPFQIVAMEKKTQTYVMHESRFRKRGGVKVAVTNRKVEALKAISCRF